MSAAEPTQRLASLDQFRGYTVLGMFLVNFVAGYRHVPRWLHFEHTYCSYHDTIMPQFFLAVGFALLPLTATDATWLVHVALWVAVALTVVSGLQYVQAGSRLATTMGTRRV